MYPWYRFIVIVQNFNTANMTLKIQCKRIVLKIYGVFPGGNSQFGI